MKKIYLMCIMGIGFLMVGCGNKETKTVTESIFSETVEDTISTEETTDAGVSEVVDEIKENIEEVFDSKNLDISEDVLLVEKPATYLNYWDESTNETRVSYSMQGLAIINEGYEKLQNVLDNQAKEEYLAFEEDYNENCEFFKENADTAYDENWTSTNEITVTRTDSQVLSFYEQLYTYLGGAHPDSARLGYNYDAQTGEELSLKEYVANYEELYDLVIEYLENNFTEEDGLFEDYKDTVYKDFFEQQTDEYGITYKVNWYVEKNALHVCFNEYEIGPHSLGTIDIPFYVDDYEDVLGELNFEKTASYAKKFYTYQNILVDLDNDGELETVEVETEDINPGEDGIYLKVNVTDDGNTSTCTEEEWYELDQLYLIKNSVGKYYLYADIKEYNDYHTLAIFDLNGSEPKFVDNADGLWENNIIDTENFYLSTRDDVLGTYENTCLYYVGEDGLPCRKDDKTVILSYAFDKFFEDGFHREAYNYVTLKMDISGENENILSGTEWQPVEVINNEKVILVSPNGKKIELKLEPDTEAGWGYLINGISQDELFDGIFYAG